MQNETIEQCAERIVRQEVYLCVSALVSTLAGGSGFVSSKPKRHGLTDGGNDLATLCEKAYELASPVEDWEEAAIQNKWAHGGDNQGFWYDSSVYESWKAALSDPDSATFMTAQELCEACDIEPYQREVFEHWAVSQWLADKLIAQGERVDTDFEGLNVWARTCTGQGIACDGVLHAIAREVLQPLEVRLKEAGAKAEKEAASAKEQRRLSRL